MSMLARIGVLLWGAAVLGGLALIAHYSTRPGAVGTAPAQWSAAAIKPPPGRAVLLMFAHPRCGCTRASLSELRNIMEAAGDQVSAYVLMTRPRGTGADWERTPSWDAAAAIPGVTVLADIDGEQARRFGGETSGYVVVYDAQGHLAFSGGITGSRGHIGDNAGRRRVIRTIQGEPADRADHQVYGCPLKDLPERIL